MIGYAAVESLPSVIIYDNYILISIFFEKEIEGKERGKEKSIQCWT